MLSGAIDEFLKGLMVILYLLILSCISLSLPPSLPLSLSLSLSLPFSLSQPHLSKKAQSKANQVLEQSVSKVKEQLVRKEGDVTLVTPLVSSTRSRRK